jgi:mannose-6-phosphate isomerase
MAIEHARARAVPKPWGVDDLSPWSSASSHGKAIGEIRYDRPDTVAADPSLLLKLLFTSQPLSIQVHPDDKFAHLMGLPNGKTEAWYVLSAAPEAKVAVGLKLRLTPQQLRGAIDDGSISDLIAWHAVAANDVISVAAGTIHAIGAGLVIAEIQQRSDVTFRLFDYGRQRELHVEDAIAAAVAGPVEFSARSNQLSAERQLLVSNPHFVFERINLAPNSSWCMEAERETWLLVLGGSALAGAFDIATGDVLFAQSDRIDIHSGAIGLVALAAYTGGGPVPNLLQRLTQPGAINVRAPRETDAPSSLGQPMISLTNGRVETIE